MTLALNNPTKFDMPKKKTNKTKKTKKKTKTKKQQKTKNNQPIILLMFKILLYSLSFFFFWRNTFP